MSEASKEKRAKIANRVRALLQMTQGHGCSEAEALAAAQKAGELMAEHALAAEDLEDIKSERFGFRSRPGYAWRKGNRSHYHEVLNCTWAISKLFDCECFFRTDTTELTYFGTQLDTELAHYLTSRLKNAMELEWQLFKKLPAYEIDKLSGIHPKTMRAQFMATFAWRVSDRLKMMKADQRNIIASNSTANALIICKEGIIKEKFAEAHPSKIKTRKTKVRISKYSASAQAAGEAAGNRISLDARGIGQKDEQRRLA